MNRGTYVTEDFSPTTGYVNGWGYKILNALQSDVPNRTYLYIRDDASKDYCVATFNVETRYLEVFARFTYEKDAWAYWNQCILAQEDAYQVAIDEAHEAGFQKARSTPTTFTYWGLTWMVAPVPGRPNVWNLAVRNNHTGEVSEVELLNHGYKHALDALITSVGDHRYSRRTPMDDRFHRVTAGFDLRMWAVGFGWGVFAQFGDRTIREVVVYLGPLCVNVLIGDLAPADQEDTDAG